MARTIAKDYGDKRQLILTRAAQLFADDGFDRASVSKVATACKISKANIYHYYKSKDEILFDILDKYLSELRDTICGIKVGDQGPEAQFRATVTGILVAYQGADFEHRLQANAMTFLPEDQQNVLRGYQRDLVKHVSGLVGAIAPDAFAGEKAKLHAATMSLFGMLNWFYMWNGQADLKAREDYADIVCTLFLSGVPGL